VTDLDDDLDWLYRRGRYADGSAAAPGADLSAQPTRRTPSPAVASQTRPAPRPRPVQASAPTRPVRAPRPATTGRRRRRWPLLVIGLLLLGLVGFVVYAVAVPMQAWSQMKHVAYVPDGNRPADQPGTLLLLTGSDSREGLTPEQMQKYGTGVEGANAADTIMLLYMPPSGRPALISIPRDSYVQIPGRKMNKINAAFSIGGPKLLTQTIEQNTGLRIDGYLSIGFGGFVTLIDSIGGIEQCPAYDIKDQDSHLDLKKGCQLMDGITALNYVRMRHADPLGDLGRVQRQRGMVAAVAKKVVTPTLLLDPGKYAATNKAGAAVLKAGEGTGLGEIAPAALAFLAISKGDGLTLTVPVSNPNLSTPAGSSVEWDKAKAAEMFAMVAKGDTAGLEKFKK